MGLGERFVTSAPCDADSSSTDLAALFLYRSPHLKYRSVMIHMLPNREKGTDIKKNMENKVRNTMSERLKKETKRHVKRTKARQNKKRLDRQLSLCMCACVHVCVCVFVSANE